MALSSETSIGTGTDDKVGGSSGSHGGVAGGWLILIRLIIFQLQAAETTLQLGLALLLLARFQGTMVAIKKSTNAV